MKNNHKGYSLIELIVVIAIMSIVVGMVTVILPRDNAKVKECITTIEGALMETRANALSRESAYMSLGVDASGKKYEVLISGKNGLRVGDMSTTIRVYYQFEDGSEPVNNYFDVSAANSLMLGYNRASGSFMPIITSVDANGNPATYMTRSDGGTDKNCFCSKIEATRGTKTKTLILVKDTGKVYLDD